jgi:hypothetical protein
VLTALGLAVEIGDWNRFTGNTIGAYLGLVPSEHSSGASRSQGGITKTGNTRARRLLVEAAWHHRRPYNSVSVTCAPAGTSRTKRPVSAAIKATTGCTASGNSSKPDTNAGSSPTSPLPANWLAGAGPSPPRYNRNSHGRMNRYLTSSRPRRSSCPTLMPD